MLAWVFGDVKENVVHLNTHDRASGYLEFEKARVRWFLSINSDLLPVDVKENGGVSYRFISVDGEEIEFSRGFSNLHTRAYEKIIDGKGFGVKSTRSAIELIHSIRTKNPIGLKGDFHPFTKLELCRHPFKKDI